MSDQIKPILKYVGGKFKLAGGIFKDSDFEGVKEYIEPFVGGGGSFCYVMNKYGSQIEKVRLYDSNEQLIHLYQIVKERPEDLIRVLKQYAQAYDGTKEQFIVWREKYNSVIYESTLERASLFVVMNKTCFRGMYRTSKTGKFNVPFGNYKSLNVDEESIRALSKVLIEKKARIQVLSFTKQGYIMERADILMYLDPPYLETFSDYQKEGFALSCHEEIRECLKETKCKWVLSSSNNEWITQHFVCDFLTARRSINAKKPESTTEEVVTRELHV